jgi:hydrogenase maturation protease
MDSSSQQEILLIGVGNPLRGDDAAGRLVANLIRKRQPSSFRVIEHDGEGASLIEAWAGAQKVIIVDAVSSEALPGTIYRFDAVEQSLPGKVFQNSTHAFGLCEAVELARTLHRLPRQLIIYGIAGKSFDTGGRLSVEVESAVSHVAERILRERTEKPDNRGYSLNRWFWIGKRSERCRIL